MYEIVILMFLPFAEPNENDALTVTHRHGRVIEFRRLEACYEHVERNLDALKAFAGQEFPGVPVAKIECFQKRTSL